MYKYLLLLILISCQANSTKQESTLSVGQQRIINLVGEYSSDYKKAKNSILKREVEEKYTDKIHSYITDSLNSELKNFQVRTGSVGMVEIGSIWALVADFKDEDKNEYWMEINYPNRKQLENDSTYKLIKSLPSNVDTVITFSYMGGVDIHKDIIGSEPIRIRVKPVAIGTILPNQ